MFELPKPFIFTKPSFHNKKTHSIVLLAPAAACSQLIACSTQEDLALKEQESRTKVLPKYLWLEADSQKHSKAWGRCGESFSLPLHSACVKSLFSGFASRACDGSKELLGMAAWDATSVPMCSPQGSCSGLREWVWLPCAPASLSLLQE